MCVDCWRSRCLLCCAVPVHVPDHSVYNIVVYGQNLRLLHNLDIQALFPKLLRIHSVPSPGLLVQQKGFVYFYEGWITRCNFYRLLDGFHCDCRS